MSMNEALRMYVPQGTSPPLSTGKKCAKVFLILVGIGVFASLGTIGLYAALQSEGAFGLSQTGGAIMGGAGIVVGLVMIGGSFLIKEKSNANCRELQFHNLPENQWVNYSELPEGQYKFVNDHMDDGEDRHPNSMRIVRRTHEGTLERSSFLLDMQGKPYQYDTRIPVYIPGYRQNLNSA